MIPTKYTRAGALVAGALLLSTQARAFELTQLNEEPLRLDITATTLSSWHGDNRNTDIADDHYGDLFNRINFQLGYGQFVGALRLDTATYFESFNAMQLARKQVADPNDELALEDAYKKIRRTLSTRYRPEYVPGRFYLGYTSSNFEVTAGDSYVQFGRGLALSLRKQDELGIDSSLRGGKLVARTDMLTFTVVGGVANPMLVDYATGLSLEKLSPSAPDANAVLYAPDTIIGGRAELASEGWGIGVHAVRMIRGSNADFQFSPPAATFVYGTTITGLTGQVPLPAKLGGIYLEGAVQQNSPAFQEFKRHGYALYAAIDVGLGAWTGLIELQHYRSFDGLIASVNTGLAPAFNTLRYTAAPTTEPIDTDYRLGYFDRCVSGGRARLDRRLTKTLLVYGTFGAWSTWSERDVNCSTDPSSRMRNDALDGSLGLELQFDDGKSHVFASSGLRHDLAAGNPATIEPVNYMFYGHWYLKAQVEKHIDGPWSTELEFRERRKIEQQQYGLLQAWNEGEVYLSLHYAPAIVGTLGFEYTGDPTKQHTYYNASGGWKYANDSLVRLFVGQQLGARKCIGGTCRVFPDFSGVKLEWVQRY